MNAAGISRRAADPALRRVQAHLHRVEVEDAVARDHDLAVERGVGREQLAERAQLREVAQQRAPVARPERELAAVVLEHAAEAVPLRLVLPAVALGELADELGLHRREGDVRAGARDRRLSLPDAPRRDHGSGSGHADRQRHAVDVGGRRRRAQRHRLDPRLRRERASRCGSRPRSRTSTDPRRRLAEGGAPARPQRAARAGGREGGGGRRRRSTRATSPSGSGSSSARRSAASSGSWSRPRCCANAGPTGSRRTSSRTCSSTRRAGSSRSRSGSAARTTRRSRPARPARTRSARAPSSIRRGDADAVLAGGTEACMHPLILAGFCAMRGLAAEEEHPPRASRPFDATRAGFVMGEGGVRARARGARGRAGARRDRLRRGARLRRLERRAPHGAARAGGDRRRAR